MYIIGFRDTVTDGHNGYLFQPKNIEDFRKYINVLKHNQPLRQQMGQNGLESVKNLGINDVVHDILEWYETGRKKQQYKINNVFVVFRNFIMLTTYVPFLIMLHNIHHFAVELMKLVGL